MVEYAHEKAEAAVKALIASDGDPKIAEVLATYLLVGQTPPVTLRINHNPKVAPCPLRVDRAGAKSCSVTLRTIVEANTWCIDALMRGYEVTCGTRRGQETRSVADERRSIRFRADAATYRAQRAAGLIPEDDEIPF